MTPRQVALRDANAFLARVLRDHHERLAFPRRWAARQRLADLTAAIKADWQRWQSRRGGN